MKKRRLEAEILSSDDDVSLPQNSNSWARFIVIESKNGLPLKINPFAISKAVKGICGEVFNVSRLRGGSLFVECARRQQAVNLLKCSTFANTEVSVSVHRTLNSRHSNYFDIIMAYNHSCSSRHEKETFGS